MSDINSAILERLEKKLFTVKSGIRVYLVASPKIFRGNQMFIYFVWEKFIFSVHI
mgnify:CR=1 FL=1